MHTLHHIIQNCDPELLSRINAETYVAVLYQMLYSATADEGAIINARIASINFLVA